MSAKTNQSIWMVLVTLILVTSAPTFAGQIIYVDDDGPADFNNIQAAINDSKDGDIIIVNPGTYTGDGNWDIEYNGKAITVCSIDPNDPNIVAATIIDCNGSAAEPHRGFFFHNDEDSNSILAGLTITNGYAECGGGICCEESSPTITNCIITANTAHNDGGGVCSCLSIFIPPLPGEPIPECNFPGPTITNCTISGNSAQWGGGIYNEDSSPAITNCTITGNTAQNDGGGIYFSLLPFSPPPGVPLPESNIPGPTLTDCTLDGNWASKGGGICNVENSSATLKNCIFSENSADFGGGIYNKESRLVLTDCTFTGNSADYFCGGGIYCQDSRPIITNCAFTDNTAYFWGGGICLFWSSSVKEGPDPPPHLTSTTTLNTVDEQSLQAALSDSNIPGPLITNCIFSGNSASCGGGLATSEPGSIVVNCIFTGNSAQEGGGILVSVSNLILTNCTFNGNFAPTGKALVCYSFFDVPNSVFAANCILWDGDNEIWHDDNSTITISYSDVQGGWPGEGNIDAAPCFVDPGYYDANGLWIEGDYHLLSDSPCIDAGDPSYVAEPNATDLDGKPRVINGRIDMGAYEYVPPIPSEVNIDPNTLNLNSKGKWITAFICLPEEYNVADIDPNSVFLEGEIKPERFWLTEDNQIAIAKFSREDVQAILHVGEVELTITGRLTDGSPFEAKDIIKVIDKGGGKSGNGLGHPLRE